MKLFFLKDHSLYKIFKTLEKIPNNKTIQIYIDPEHAFFDNERWGRQIQELLQKKNLNAFFVTKTEKAKHFFEKLGLQVIHQEKHQILKILNLAYLFFFNIKRFHLQVYTKKNYIFYMIFGLEVVFLLVVLYFLYSLILPRTILKIIPSNQIENIIYNFRYYPKADNQYAQTSRSLIIPFQTGFIDYKYTMSISADNIKHIQNPSQGEVRVVNNTDKEYTLLKGTRFQTNDGLIFKSNAYFKVPPQTEKEPGQNRVTVVAADQDDQGVLIGSRGNLKRGNILYIKNLKNSYFLKQVYAIATQDFSGGSLTSQGIVTPKDIDVLSGKLVAYIDQQRKNIITQNFNMPGKIFLNFDNLMQTSTQQISIENTPGQQTPYLKGYIVSRLQFAYIDQADLMNQVKKYILQRPSDKTKLISIDKSSVVFFNNVKQDPYGAYIIPTKVNIIEGYDFQKDINGVVESIKNNILGNTRAEAKTLLYSYPEISSANIVIRPPRYGTVTRLKSRVQVEIQGQ